MFQVQSKRSLKSALLVGAATATALGLSVPANAADATETVVVTGSRIPQSGLYSSSPLQSIGQQEMTLKGSTSVESLLRDLPSVYNDGDNSATNNASNGVATIDLHDLTPIRTLVLVDGKRLVAADYLGNVDINNIPATLVDHIEILTGGASSVYGGDAVAGVVNLVLKKDFEGMSVDSSFSSPFHSDGAIATTEAIMGFTSSDGKGNVTIYGGWQDRQPTFQGDRARSSFSLNSPAELAAHSLHVCSAAVQAQHFGFCPGGSSGIPEGRLSAGAGAGNMFATNGTLVPYDGHLYNFAPINYLQTPNTHWDFGATAHYEVNPALDFYTRLTFADNKASSQLAEVPTNQGFQTNFGNPLMTPQEQGIIFNAANVAAGLCTASGPGGTFLDTDTCSFNLRRRLVENGPRRSNEDHEAYQMVIGVKGDIGSGWSYDVSAQYGRTVWTHILTGDASGTRFQQALLAGGTAANPVCLDPSNGCVPIDIFHGAGALTPAQVNFFTVKLNAIAVSEEYDAQASITGNLGEWGIQSPLASAPVAVAFGTEWRREAASFSPDSCLALNGCSLGFGATPPTGGSYLTTEGFGEIQVPLVTDKAFFKQLELDAGFRYSDYNRAGPVTSFKFGVSWQPVDDVRFRGSFNRAIREANVAELFRGATFSAPSGTDPCAGGTSYTPTLALCLASGVKDPTDYLNGNGQGVLVCGGQCASYLKGNPLLKPETGDTKSFGIVFTPTFIDGFTATIDYYNIAIGQAIVALPFDTIVGACFDPAKNPSQSFAIPACGAVHRGPFGELYSTTGFVDQTFDNIGNVKTQGIDFELNYATDLTTFGFDDGLGSVTGNFMGTYLAKTSFKPSPTANEEICTGQFGPVCGAPAAKWRNALRITWTSSDSDIDVSFRWRYVGAVSFDQFTRHIIDDPLENHIPDFNYFDLSGDWSLGYGIDLRGGINNIFDKKPPIVDGSFAGAANVDSGNTFPGTYDAIGRTFFVGVNVKY